MKRFYFAAALAAMVLTACSSEEESVQPVPESAPIVFKSVCSLDVVTRVTTSEFTDTFSVFITGVTTATKSVEYNAADSKWTFVGGDVQVDRTGGELVAWYPTDLVTPAEGKVEATLTSQKEVAAQDLIYFHKKVTSTSNEVAIELGHAYARLSFVVEAGTGYTGAGELTQVQITGGIPATGTLDLTVADAVPAAGAALSTAIVLAKDETALVVPVATEPTIAVTCTIDGEQFTASVNNPTAMPSLVAGTEYQIKLTLIGKNAAITSVKQVNWTQTPVEGGDIF